MNRTKIDWCDMSWNPVVGCNNTCEYCYARKIATRFGKSHDDDCDIHILNESTKNPYPFGFSPTLHRYRLDEPKKLTVPKTIFVCSMSDLFASYIPDDWINEVFEACRNAIHHKYIFLTKNPSRYMELEKNGILLNGDNIWYGTTTTTENDPFWYSRTHNTFISIEPVLGYFHKKRYNAPFPDWVIIGAETGNRKDKIIPSRECIENIVNACEDVKVPVFMKSSLIDIMCNDFVQEFPW